MRRGKNCLNFLSSKYHVYYNLYKTGQTRLYITFDENSIHDCGALLGSSDVCIYFHMALLGAGTQFKSDIRKPKHLIQLAAFVHNDYCLQA